MSFSIKHTARIRGIRPEMIVGLLVVKSCFDELDKDCIITSANDSTHSDTSLHYTGCGLDFRTKHLQDHERALLMGRLKVRLGPDFDCLLEGEGTQNEHLHVEYQPKGA